VFHPIDPQGETDMPTVYRVFTATTRQFGGSDHKKEFTDREEAMAYARKKGDRVTGFQRVTIEDVEWRGPGEESQETSQD
jgi:nitrous oxide reductase accessory protein NosL